MKIFYSGADITNLVPASSAFARDFDGTSADSLEVTFYDSKKWHNEWRPAFGDAVEIQEGSYTTGRMYVDRIEPDENGYTILARSTPRVARERAYAGYSLITLKQLAEKAASDLGMGARLWGAASSALYHRALRRDEGWLSMLSRYANLEGNAVKCANGMIHLIGMDWAQAQPASEYLQLSEKTPGVTLAVQDAKYSACVVYAANGRGKAVDQGAPDSGTLTLYGLPAADANQAARWARWSLYFNNRAAEKLSIDSGLAANRAAFQRITITGTYAGEWMVHSVMHDFKNKKSRTTLLKCLGSITEVAL